VRDDKPFYFKDGRVLWIKSNKKQINSVFLKHYLKQRFMADYSKIASGTTFAELKIFALKALGVYLPHMDIQNHFAKVIASIEEQKANYVFQEQTFDSLFASIQHRAFRGEL
jgi:type I restriction enzyme S subunit